jgi:SNF2 family DNA or RNA helicase
MARIIRGFLGRYARYISRTFNFGSEGQQRGIFQRQLSMGNSNGTMQQHSLQQENPNSNRGNDRNKCRGVLWIKKRDITCPNNPVWMGHNKSVADSTGTEEVYDIKNAGPRNRFTVKGGNNEPMIVHNCGSVYSDDGKTIYFDISNRLSELEAVIDESLQKVIVFAPYTHTIEVIEAYLQKKKIPCAVINGAVSSTKRAAIIENFQTTQDLRVIIIQPQAAAHGITLTAANTIVWFGPTPSVETYLQANARAHRNGQQHKVTVIMIQGSPAEEKMYKMLNSKIDHHMKLIDLYDEVLHE